MEKLGPMIIMKSFHRILLGLIFFGFLTSDTNGLKSDRSVRDYGISHRRRNLIMGMPQSSNLQNILLTIGAGPIIDVLDKGAENIANLNLSPSCFNHVNEYMDLLQKTMKNGSSDSLWPLQMFDATAKFPTGILEGNLAWFGSYTECIDIDVYLDKNVTFKQFQGQYCTVLLSSEEGGILQDYGQMIQMGWCFPSTCSADEISVIIKNLFGALGLPNLRASAYPENCVVKNQYGDFDGPAKAMIAVCCVFGSVMLLATVHDISLLYKSDPNDDPDQIMKKNVAHAGRVTRAFLAFSVYRNGRKLLNTKSSADTLGCLHGIRVISMLWVLLGHVYDFGSWFPFKNELRVMDILKHFAYQAICNATPSTDSFFFLSGFLVGYVVLKEMKKTKGRFNLFLFYFHRFWRLTPMYMLTIGVITALINYIAYGPLWHTVDEVVNEPCREYWWASMLYISNFFKGSEQCNPVTWYLAVDMQFYVVAPIFLVALYWYPKFGTLLCYVGVVVSAIVAGVLINANDLEATYMMAGAFAARTSDWNDIYYEKPWCRIGPYLIGMLLAKFILENGKTLKMDSVVVATGWVIAALTNLLVIYGPYSYFSSEQTLSRTTNFIYGALNRTAWSMGVAWVVLACVTGHGGFVNKFLSWKLFLPLSRLTYAAYLVHMYVLLFFYLTRQDDMYFDQVLATIIYLGAVVITFLIALPLSLAFEAPMIELEKVLLGGLMDNSKRATSHKPLNRVVTGNVDQKSYLPTNMQILTSQ